MSAVRTVIQTVDITKVFGVGDISVVALNGVSIQIAAGEFIAIMGPSGSGKSTLLHILGCLSRPTSGKYILDGEDVSDLDKVELAGVRNRKLGFIFQAYNLLARTSALKNVTLPLLYNHDGLTSREGGEEKARAVLETVGLGDRIHHQPHELSGGQQQRVAIARALINDPTLVIADEPTGNLDSHSGEEIMNLLHKLHSQGTTIIMVTHNPKIAANTQRTITLVDGLVDNIMQNGKDHAP
jgi:putative ABC transport system ATP-binding protein